MDYAALAEAIDEMRESLRACVAALMEDGYTEEQARTLIVDSMHVEAMKQQGGA